MPSTQTTYGQHEEGKVIDKKPRNPYVLNVQQCPTAWQRTRNCSQRKGMRLAISIHQIMDVEPIHIIHQTKKKT